MAIQSSTPPTPATKGGEENSGSGVVQAVEEGVPVVVGKPRKGLEVSEGVEVAVVVVGGESCGERCCGEGRSCLRRRML